MNVLRDKIQIFFDGLNHREQILVSAAGVVCALAFLYMLIVAPILNGLAWSAARLDAGEQAMMQADRLLLQYEKVHADLTAVEEAIQAGPRGNLVTTLANLAKESQVKVDSMQPQAGASSPGYKETRVQVELKEVTLVKLIQYLFGIESAQQHISVKTLSIKTLSKKPGLLNATFSVSSFDPV